MKQILREINDDYKINEPKDIYEKYLKEYGDEDREHFIVIGLDNKNKVVYREIANIGIINSCMISAGTTFRKAIIMNCNSIIIAHNHPSQDLEPSTEDYTIYKELKKAGKILQIEVLDALVFGKNEYLSLNK